MKIHHSNTSHGNLCFRYGNEAEVIKNRLKFFKEVGIDPRKTVVMKVDHKDEIKVISKKDCGKGVFDLDSAILSDAFITNKKDINLMLLTADCIPLSIYDPQNHVVALVHLGWQSAALNLLTKTIETFRTKCKSKYKDLEINLGPSIDAESYIHKSPTQIDDPAWKPFLLKTKDGYKVDLKGFVIDQIKKISPEIKIIVNPENTAISKLYFSHYTSQQNGSEEKRFATVIRL